MQLGRCRVRMALPALGVDELNRLMESCAAALKDEDETTAAALTRGRAGWLLDRLIPVLACFDRPGEVALVMSQQLGQGSSKQAARSFQRLLRRLSPSEAQVVLRTALQSHLKVAERVALLRDLSDLHLFDAEAGDGALVGLLESLYDGHRDVGGAVLGALCRMGSTSLLAKVSQDEGSVYQLQVLLGQLQGLRGQQAWGDWGDEVARILTTLCQRPGLEVQALQALASWARSTKSGACDAGTVAQVAAASSQALSSSSDDLWEPAARCLISLAHQDSSPLQTVFLQLSSDTDVLRAAARLRVLTQALVRMQAPLAFLASGCPALNRITSKR